MAARAVLDRWCRARVGPEGLDALADQLDDMVKKKLNEHEKDFFLAYKSHMSAFDKPGLGQVGGYSKSLSILKKGESKKEFDKHPVLDRMELQLQESNIPTKYTKNIVTYSKI